MKKVFATLVIAAMATTSYAQMAIGLKVPFSMSTFSWEKSSSSEMWVGGAGAFEYTLLPVLGIELGAGYSMSLGGKDEYDGTTTAEYKNNIIPISVLLKFYLPVGEGSPIHPYFGGGPTIGITMTTTSYKTNDEYEKIGSTTAITLGAPTFTAGIGYDISESIKIGGALNLQFGYDSYSPEVGDSQSGTTMNLGIALGFKYCL